MTKTNAKRTRNDKTLSPDRKHPRPKNSRGGFKVRKSLEDKSLIDLSTYTKDVVSILDMESSVEKKDLKQNAQVKRLEHDNTHNSVAEKEGQKDTNNQEECAGKIDPQNKDKVDLDPHLLQDIESNNERNEKEFGEMTGLNLDSEHSTYKANYRADFLKLKAKMDQMEDSRLNKDIGPK